MKINAFSPLVGAFLPCIEEYFAKPALISAMLSTVHTVAINGLTASRVLIEINVTRFDQPRDALFVMVGLPDSAVKESKTRVRSALENSGYPLASGTDMAINFAPADVKKEGSSYDLPLAVGLLLSHERIHPVDLQIERCMFLGELGLNGDLRPVRGVLPAAILARSMGYTTLFVPEENAREAAVVDRVQVFGVRHLTEVIGHLEGRAPLLPTIVDTRAEFYAAQETFPYDFSEVKGQPLVKRAFEVAAAGGHNLLLVGSPGCGKSMMAKRLPSILPPLSLAESLETTQIHSVAGKLGRGDTLISTRPFRSPHHTISDVALIGGGAHLQPGEVSLAHNGVLFLDEFPEYSKNALETLRQPLEDRQISISRARYNVTLPCSFMLVAAMNPCPCGYYNDPHHPCTCRPGQVQRYMSRISGPLLDRIDLQVEVVPVSVRELSSAPAGESSAAIRARVVAARRRQAARFSDCPGVHCNAQMAARHIKAFVHLDESAHTALEQALDRLGLSARAYERVLKVSLTLADLDGVDQITRTHIAEAISYRNLDRASWGE